MLRYLKWALNHMEYFAIAGGGLYYLYDFIKNFDLYKTKWDFDEVIKATGTKTRLDTTFSAKEVIKTRYGYKIIIQLPKGLAYEELEKLLPKIETGLKGVAELEWNRFDGTATMKFAPQDYDMSKKFEPIKTEGPWELYFGETFFLEKIFGNMKDMPHVLVAGATASGKSRCVYIAITNLLYWYDETMVEIYLIQVSDKKDLNKYANCKQTKYFAKNLQTTDQLLIYLLGLMKERNKKLGNLNNIYEYNEKHPEDPMKTCYVIIDEGARLMFGEKEIDPEYKLKKRIMTNLTHLSQEGRSAGIYIIESLQRPDKVNLDPNTKNNFNIKIGFRANNIASSKVMADDDSLFNLPNREALFMGSTYKTLKTPFIDDKLIYELLKHRYEENHKYINIFPPAKEEKSQDNVVPIEKKPKKSKGVLRKC